MASANLGCFFSNTLNFLLTWSLVLVIWLATIVKSLPYFFRSETKVATQVLDQQELFCLCLTIGLGLCWSLCWRVIESMKVERVERVQTDDYPLEFSWACMESTVMQKTLPTVFESEELEGAGLLGQENGVIVVVGHQQSEGVQIEYKRIGTQAPAGYQYSIDIHLNFFYISTSSTPKLSARNAPPVDITTSYIFTYPILSYINYPILSYINYHSDNHALNPTPWQGLKSMVQDPGRKKPTTSSPLFFLLLLTQPHPPFLISPICNFIQSDHRCQEIYLSLLSTDQSEIHSIPDHQSISMPLIQYSSRKVYKRPFFELNALALVAG